MRAVLPASERIDLPKVGELVGASGKKVHLATEDDLAATTLSSSSAPCRLSAARETG